MARNLFEASGGSKHRIIPDGLVGYSISRPLKYSDKITITISQSVMKKAGLVHGDRIVPIWEYDTKEMILEKSDYGFKITKQGDKGIIYITHKDGMNVPTPENRIDITPLISKHKIILSIKNK